MDPPDFMQQRSSSPPTISTWPEGPDAPIAADNPPAYDQARIPLEAVNYTFSPQAFNTMLLLPPSGLPDTRPQYHISVAMNCMNPHSFITTVRRGASDSGPVVGEFEMGISTIPGTVCIGNCQKTIKDALPSKHQNKWIWQFRDDTSQHIRWELSSFGAGLFNCFFASDHHPASTHLRIAQFRGAPYNLKDNQRTPPSMLRVYPTGQALFDEILITALILERRRLQPQNPNKPAYSWWS